MSKQTGGISVNTENIFPIIKKWLYSEKDIFLRELVSNACDAVTKHRRLVSLGEATESAAPYRIDVRLDKKARTITVEDNGIGMSEEELKRYICSIALSGAVDFINKYEGEGENGKNGIIGHFGLGFYSAFMVAEQVEIHTRSHTGAPAVHWSCNGEGEYEIDADDREEAGTEVILHLEKSEKEYLAPEKLRAMLGKYCAFMPVPIYFDDGTKKEDAEEVPVNDVAPLWQKPVSDCTDEEYKDFYKKLFADFREPLFYIHLNADYPLNFKGILYFPRLGNRFDSLEGEVKLYYNQVFVADNVGEVIPEYLLMLRGVLDCPELPLNVSRSYLQTNSYVAKLSAHIVKKVADKLVSLAKKDRPYFESVWSDIKPFVEYAALRDEKFRDRVKDHLLLALTDGTHVTIDEYLEGAKEKHENTIYYTTDKALQAQYIAMYREAGIAVAELDGVLDTQFIAAEEAKRAGVRFLRVDADLAHLKEGDATENEALTTLFTEVAGEDKLTVKQENLASTAAPCVLSVSEESRRMEDMMRMYRLSAGEDGAFAFPLDMTLTLNLNAPLIAKLSALIDTDRTRAVAVATFIYRLALLQSRKLKEEEMTALLSEGYTLLGDLL
ncbi:MAG: molecular chaperone HtpG [Clostridia bacterium]|nr:molecular chaperone HtpG [Clostridia bacterium]